MTAKAFDFFDGILYINLERRSDRPNIIKRQLRQFSLRRDKVFRIEAVIDELNGARGCVLSHIRALSFAIEKNGQHVLILKDDCIFIANKARIERYCKIFLTHF